MKCFKLLLSAMLLSSALIVNAQLSKADADKLVLNTIINDTTKTVYTLNEPLSHGESVMTAEGVDLQNPYNNSFVYFIDDMPLANWVHPCRYIFINIEDSSYTIEEEDIYPNDYHAFVRISKRTYKNRTQWPHTTYTIPPKATPNSKLYAVLIAGDVGPDGDDVKSWFNLSCVYTTLVNKYGFIENNSNSHIIVCTNYEVHYAMNYLNNSPLLYPEVDLNHSGGIDNCFDFYTDYNHKNDIKKIFDNLSGEQHSLSDVPELSENDQLFVFICGVGSSNNNTQKIMLKRGQNAEYLTDSDLTTYVKKIKCSQMTFFIDCNFAGGFIDELMGDTSAECQNRAVHTSTDVTHKSWSEQYISEYTGRGGGGDTGLVDEYVYYWAAASLGYYPILGTYTSTDSISGPWYKYSYTAIGEFPWYEINTFNDPYGTQHSAYDVNPDTNNDNTLSMEEAFKFADNLDSYSHNGYFNPINTMANGDSCVEYPGHAYESTFTKELITLNGYRGTIGDDAATGAGHKYTLADNVTVVPNSTLTISNNSLIEGKNKILTNYGSITTSTNTNNATFKRVTFNNLGGSMSYTNCVFDTCNTMFTCDGPLMIENSIFNRTRLHVYVDDEHIDNYTVNISNNVFNDIGLTNRALNIEKVPQCNVIDNSITSGGNGIFISNLSGLYSNYVFNNNTIYNCSYSGFVSYASNGILNGNNISYNNTDGLQSYNLSGLHVKGDSLAPNKFVTQRLTFNGRYQVHATNNSYPIDFHYNWLAENTNSNYYILYYESNHSYGSRPLVFNVTNNCWDPLSDNQISSHLLSTGNTTFNYLPTWNPSGPYSMPDALETILALGNNYAESGDYEEAKETFMGLVSNYPDSPEAITALKALFSVEIASGSDFIDLKDYYLELIADNNLGIVADNLANRCDIRIGNYSDAINWYEDKIIDPNTSYSERIFAEIDLGDLYLQMNNNGTRAIQGKLTEYIPVSKEAHESRSDHLLSLLPGGIEEEKTCNTIATQMSCSPNPTNGKTTLLYTLSDDSDIEIFVFDMLGNEVLHVNSVKQNSGSHEAELDLSNMPDGMYFCNIYTGNNNNETLKIIKH